MIAGSQLSARFGSSTIAGCVLFCDGDTGTASSWTDLSGSGNHLLQATASLQPTFLAGAANGHRVYRTDGVDDFMQASFTLVQPQTIFLVCRSVVIGAPGAHEGLLDGATNLSAFIGNDTGPQVQLYDGVSLTIAQNVANKVFACITAVVNGASSSLRHKCAQLIAGNAGTSLNASGITIGATGSGARPSNTDYAAVIVYNTALSAGNIALVESYLTQRFAL